MRLNEISHECETSVNVSTLEAIGVSLYMSGGRALKVKDELNINVISATKNFLMYIIDDISFCIGSGRIIS